MGLIDEALNAWLQPVLSEGIEHNLTGLFDAVNSQLTSVTGEVGKTPIGFNFQIHTMVHNLSNNVILPIAGVILSAVMTLELIHMVTERNNMQDFDTWAIFRWVFRAAAAILIVSNTWNLISGVFDLASRVIYLAQPSVGNSSIDISTLMANLKTQLEGESLGRLLMLYLQTCLMFLASMVMRIIVFVVVYARMMEIYLVTSVAPIPMATMLNRTWGSIGQNYIRYIFSLAFQGFLIIVCVAVYSLLLGNLTFTSDFSASLWECIGYTALLCLMLIRTGSLSKALFGAH